MKLCTERERTRNSLVTISAVSSAELATLSDQSFVISLIIPFYKSDNTVHFKHNKPFCDINDTYKL